MTRIRRGMFRTAVGDLTLSVSCDVNEMLRTSFLLVLQLRLLSLKWPRTFLWKPVFLDRFFHFAPRSHGWGADLRFASLEIVPAVRPSTSRPRSAALVWTRELQSLGLCKRHTAKITQSWWARHFLGAVPLLGPCVQVLEKLVPQSGSQVFLSWRAELTVSIVHFDLELLWRSLCHRVCHIFVFIASLQPLEHMRQCFFRLRFVVGCLNVELSRASCLQDLIFQLRMISCALLAHFLLEPPSCFWPLPADLVHLWSPRRCPELHCSGWHSFEYRILPLWQLFFRYVPIVFFFFCLFDRNALSWILFFCSKLPVVSSNSCRAKCSFPEVSTNPNSSSDPGSATDTFISSSGSCCTISMVSQSWRELGRVLNMTRNCSHVVRVVVHLVWRFVWWPPCVVIVCILKQFEGRNEHLMCWLSWRKDCGEHDNEVADGPRVFVAGGTCTPRIPFGDAVSRGLRSCSQSWKTEMYWVRWRLGRDGTLRVTQPWFGATPMVALAALAATNRGVHGNSGSFEILFQEKCCSADTGAERWFCRYFEAFQGRGRSPVVSSREDGVGSEEPVLWFGFDTAWAARTCWKSRFSRRLHHEAFRAWHGTSGI